MTGFVNVLVEAMTADEKLLFGQFVKGDAVSSQGVAALENLRLVETDVETGRPQLSKVGQAVSTRL